LQQRPLETAAWNMLKRGDKVVIDERVHVVLGAQREGANFVRIVAVDVETADGLVEDTELETTFRLAQVDYDCLSVVDFEVLEQRGVLALHVRSPGSYATEPALVYLEDLLLISGIIDALALAKEIHLAARRGKAELLRLWVAKCRGSRGPVIAVGWARPSHCLLTKIADYTLADGVISPTYQYYCAGAGDMAIVGEHDLRPVTLKNFKPRDGCPYCERQGTGGRR